MSKAAATLDSDIYGDIYGDEDNDFGFVEPVIEEETATSITKTEETSPQPAQNSPTPTSSSKADLPSSLPAKPGPSSAQSSSSSLSYSAQIAQQFSTYQQTPSQERQQRQPGSSAPPKTSPIATIDSSTGDSDTVFGKKPSEMHDAG
ncbi:hypothetical protein GYMLUDRAFT_895149 [Collybiopsis luxurians FD-317 M1]|uniref:Uncharacterized protein n=1 Tax=Collybiopsis luxurians FD-317 M1 TaxID=944289 RepID=A0A0D0C9E9_9AGAR|nr:hypothetical protein GYMLUDRAFT_895149 [Collybiopsis luxurians FD-317 M1]